MRKRKKGKTWQFWLLFAGVPTIVALTCGIPVMGVIAWHDLAREHYDETIGDLLGLGCSASASLSEDDIQKVIEAGFDPALVAAAASAIPWCQGELGRQVDMGILLSIYLAETGNGTTFGSTKFTPAPGSPAARLLERFQDFDIRGRNPVAAQYISADYRSYTGHKAGEMGPGFWPPTGITICERYLAGDGDREVASCDFWNPKVGMYAIAATIAAPPYFYHSNLSREEKIKALIGWNRLESYRELLVDRAEVINLAVGDVTNVGAAFDEESTWSEDHPMSILVTFLIDSEIIEVLQEIGLVPEPSAGFLAMPLKPEGFLHISQGFNQVTHPGGDFACVQGADVIAVGKGVVVATGDTGERGYGKHVWIQHAENLFTVYGHMDEISVTEGQRVKRGQTIGLCGRTGSSTGPHVHLGFYRRGPGVALYYADALDPWKFLGKCVAVGGGLRAGGLPSESFSSLGRLLATSYFSYTFPFVVLLSVSRLNRD